MPVQNRSNVPLGTVLEGKYRITREIGRGGMATVYEAENVDIGKRIAVKVLSAELVTSRIVRERFLREARAAAAIRSPYICDVYDSGMYEERPFLVMELLEGESLYDMMTRVRRLNVATTVRVIVLSARGLGKAHEAGVVHRDMKPENIFLIKNEEGQTSVKIVDFGLAKFYETSDEDPDHVRLTRQGALFGTPAYMSPEQARGQGEVDHRCDLWALGCIAYECLTGRTVWKVDQGVAMILAQIAGAPLPTPSQYRHDLPESFDRWFARALNRDIAVRFQNAREFADSLEEALDQVTSPYLDAPASSRRVSGPPPRDASALGRPPTAPTDDTTPVTNAEARPRAEEATPSPALPDPESRPRPSRRERSLKAIATLLAAGIVALTAYAIWLYVLHPPERRATSTVDAGDDDAQPADSARPEPAKPLEREPHALQIGAAQEWLERGEIDNALRMFKEAFNNGGSGVARALLTHAAVAVESKDNACRVTGLGRPRTFDNSTASSRPTLAVTSSGMVVAWVDSHVDKTRRQGFATVLDGALRRVAPTLIITPESDKVSYPQLVPAGDKLALLYGVYGDKDGGAWVRLLGPDGRIEGKARRIAALPLSRVNSSLAAAPASTYWMAWAETVEAKTRDLMVRQLDSELEPLTPPTRLTALLPDPTETTGVDDPDTAVAHQHLYVVFVQVMKQNRTQVVLLRVALSDPALKLGLSAPEAPDASADAAAASARRDRHVGSLQAISTPEGKNAQPRLACAEQGCFVVWDDERSGANAAYVDAAKGEKLWHREFAKQGARPAVATSKSGAAVAWFEGGRVKLARIDRDGVGEPSVLARVTGYQPHPDIAAGPKPGQWYVAWRDYEAGHLETFVVRADCQ